MGTLTLLVGTAFPRVPAHFNHWVGITLAVVLILLLFDAGEMWVGITLAVVLILLLFDAGEMWVGITLAVVLILLLFDAGEMWVEITLAVVLILLLFDAGEMWVGITLAVVLILLLFDAGEMWVGITLAVVLILLLFDAGEMWVGITLAVVLEFVQPSLRTATVAVYLFIISNIGGNMPLLVPPLKAAFANHGYSAVESLRGIQVFSLIYFVPAFLHTVITVFNSYVNNLLGVRH